MFAAFFLIGIVVSASLAYAGLVRGQLQFSKSKTLTGTTSKVIGTICLLLALALTAAVAVSVLAMLKS